MPTETCHATCPEGVRQTEIQAITALYQSGRLGDIKDRARSLTERYPEDVLGYAILGSVFLQCGQCGQALAQLDQAASLAPQNPDIHNNRGIALLDLGRPVEALGCFRTALCLRPDFATAYCNQGGALEALGRLDAAMDCYEKALAIRPDYAKALYNLGNAYKDLGRLAEAVDCYEKALAIQPEYTNARINCGIALFDLGQLDAAERQARAALVAEPDRVEARNLLASVLLLTQADPTDALDVLVRALWVEERPETKRLFVICARRLEQAHVDPTVARLIIRAMTEPWARPVLLTGLATQTVLADPDMVACLSRAVLAWPRRLAEAALYEGGELEAIAGNAMLRCLLETAPVCSLELERFCTLARAVLLEAASKAAPETPSAPVLEFYAALARQCHINEYMFDVSDTEAGQARDLGEVLDAALAAGRPVPALWPLAVGCYVPLGGLRQADRLLAGDWPEAVRATFVQQIAEPAWERAARADIPRLTPIEDAVSCRVRQQYEENPYPRWIKAAPMGEPESVDTVLRRSHPLARFRPLGECDPLDILIAGCGTGQHTLETARRYRRAKVLAVDLSLSSLTYALRKTRELGLTNITYAQADILRLGDIENRFDLIESSGVLHHLADPLAGWRVLLSLLRPGGLMRVGLYSRTARRDISRARAHIAAMGYAPTIETIRRCRQELMDQQRTGEAWNSIFLSDFYSISGCRDLLFHVQESCLSLPEIAAFCREAGLEFLGFELDDPLLADYRRRHPEDRAATNLDNWAAYEAEHPDTFMEMYQFWVQKPA